jgi:hypothetical protein
VFEKLFALIFAGFFVGIPWVLVAQNIGRHSTAGELFGSLIFLLVFTAIGGYITYSFFFYEEQDTKIIGSDPEKPWTEYKEWLNPVKQDVEDKEGIMFFRVMLILLLFFLFTLYLSKDSHIGVLLFELGLVIICVKLSINAYTVIRNHKRIGKATLFLDPFPASLEGQVGGLVSLSDSIKEIPVNTTVEVYSINYSDNSLNDSPRSETKVWNVSAPAQWKRQSAHWEMMFCFDLISVGLRESSPPIADTGCEWRVKLSGETASGHKFERTFKHIPVFTTNQQSSFAKIAGVGQKEYLHKKHKRLLKEVLNFERYKQAYRKIYPVQKTKFGYFFYFAGAIFTLPGIFASIIFFNIVFMIFALSCFSIGFYSLGSSVEVRMTSKGIWSQRWLYGKKLKLQFVSTEWPIKFFESGGYTVPENGLSVDYYTIGVMSDGGQYATVANNLEGRDGLKAALEKLEIMATELGFSLSHQKKPILWRK